MHKMCYLSKKDENQLATFLIKDSNAVATKYKAEKNLYQYDNSS